MPLHLRFEKIAERHRVTTKKRRPASVHWRGRAVDGDRKRHILNIRHPVVPEEVAPFLAQAEQVLLDMGATPLAIQLELANAERFLMARVAKRKAPIVAPARPEAEPVAQSSERGRLRDRTPQRLARLIVERLGR